MRRCNWSSRFPSRILLVAVAVLSGAATGRSQDSPAAEKTRADDAVLQGRVVDSQGKPISAVRVRLYQYDEKQNWGEGRLAVTTDAQGAFRFERLPRLYYMLSAEADGFARALRAGTIPHPKLRTYKIEIIRRLLLEKSADK